ncbi:hypothetical protein [Silvanigrella sp.]|jgi:hypothetical protein|uniref:hypothetical protein n=1 Tax=Silvanigrella sp. TaxID=2024976 RepID=UPI0037C82BBE
MNKKLISALTLFLIPIQNSFGISIYENKNNSNNQWDQTFDKIPEISVDQGSIAKEEWNKFKTVIENYKKYKSASDNLNLNLKSNLMKQYFIPIQKIILKYHASLILLEETDKKYFHKTYQGKSAETVYNETLKNIEPLLNQLINQSFYSIFSFYSQQNQKFFQEVEFNSWIKAYWPTLNSENRAGFEATHYYIDSTQSLFEEEIFNSFIEPGDDKYDFKQIEYKFNEYWNNANTKPFISWKNTTKYYKFKYNDNPNLMQLYIKTNEKPSIQYIEHLKKQKNLSEIKNNSIDIYQNLIDKISYFNNKKSTITNKYLLFQNTEIKTSKLQSKTLDKCISISKNRLLRINRDNDLVNGISLKATPCIFNDKSQDWIFVKEKNNSNEFKIYSALYTGYCIDDSIIYGKSITKCHPQNQSQIWQMNSNPKKFTNKLTNLVLQIDHLDPKQNWQTNSNLINRQYLILFSLIHGTEIYTSKDWNKKEVILPIIANAIYISYFINHYHLPNKSEWFFNKVSKMNLFETLTSASQKTIIKLSQFKYSEISEIEINELFQELKNSSNELSEIQKFKISLIGIKTSYIQNKYLYHIDDKKLKDDFSKFYLSQFNNNTIDNNFATYLPFHITSAPLINYYEDTYFKIKDFFDIVEKNDGKLTNLNNNKIPTYREVWDKWSNGEWEPSSEFEQMRQEISQIKQDMPEADFDNLFRMAQDSRVIETLNNQGAPIRMSDGSGPSGSYADVGAEEIINFDDDSAIAADLNEFEEMAQVVEMINDLEILVNNVHISIQTVSEIATATTSIEAIAIGTIIP